MIDAYSFGHISVDGQSYNSDVIIYPDHVEDGWWRTEGHNLCMDDLEHVLDFKPRALIIGTGRSGMMKVPESVKKDLEESGIRFSVLRTEEAVREYNKMCAEPQDKPIVAALHLTC
jgi:hypothetical protein